VGATHFPSLKEVGIGLILPPKGSDLIKRSIDTAGCEGTGKWYEMIHRVSLTSGEELSFHFEEWRVAFEGSEKGKKGEGKVTER